MTVDRTAVALGTAAALLAVAFGAFGAHALGGRLGERGRELWRTAERYQFVHALALILLGATSGNHPAPGAIGWLFVAGIVLFCGSLYALGLGVPRRVGAITPIGGIAFLAGWGLWFGWVLAAA